VRLLLDTHVVLWQLSGSRRLGPKASAQIAQATELRFSVVSYAEIGIKAAVGKLKVPDDLPEHIARTGVGVLTLAPDHGLAVADLPPYHRDPFDRLLIAQARGEALTIVTADARFACYDVTVIDATR